MARLKVQLAFLVGGSSGIGLAAAKILAARGARVVIFARGEERLETARGQINGCALSDEPICATGSMDASDPRAAALVLGRAIEEHGVPDLLINCAGGARPRHFEEIDFALFDATIRQNLYSAWNATSVLTPHMKSRGGIIVNVSSIAGLIGVFGYTDYSSAKFALIGFSEALRCELKPHGITVAVLCPPDTDTPGLAEENRTKPEETRAISGEVKVMSPEAVAEALIKGLEKGRFLIVPGLDGRLTSLAKRFVPQGVAWFMDRTVKKIRNRTSPKS